MTIPSLNSLSTQTGNDWVNITNDLVAQANAIGPYNAITLTGGTINGVAIGGTTAAAVDVTIGVVYEVGASPATASPELCVEGSLEVSELIMSDFAKSLGL